MRQWWKEHGRKWAFRLCGLALTAAVAVSLLPEAVVVPASAVTQAEIDAMKEEANSLKQQQEEIQDQLDSLAADRENAMARKTLLEQQINATRAEINTIAAQIAKYDELIAQKQEELSQAEAEEQAQYELFCERVRYMEEQGEVSYWSILFSSKDFADLLDNAMMVEEIMDYDNQVMDQLIALREQIEEDKAELETARQEQQDAKAEDSTMKLEAIEPDKNARPIILVVEDNADIRDYIADSFTDLYEVKTAANGKEGLQIATDCIPDIIASDIMMPVMNGVVMCQKLKADIRTSHIPVILLTAKDSITDKEEGYQAGADSYLTKPFSASLLQSRISNLLTQRRLLSERFAIRPEKPERQSMEEKRAIITESMNKLDKEFLDKITNTITEGLAAAENIDITVLSNVMCMSSSTLYRKVKALTGMSTNEYIRKIKMQLAEKYLLEGKYSISEIAFKVGINSNVYFRQCFKEEFGMSASDYLKQLTGKSIDEKVDE